MTGKNVEILPATVEHIRLLCANLREDDRRECEKLGLSPFKGIWRSYRNSRTCRSYFVNGEIAAIQGINGSILGFIGNPWVMTSKVVDQYPFVFAMIYRREVREMLKEYSRLESWVDSSYTKSIQLMKILGFKEREFMPMGKQGGLFVRMEMERI